MRENFEGNRVDTWHPMVRGHGLPSCRDDDITEPVHDRSIRRIHDDCGDWSFDDRRSKNFAARLETLEIVHGGRHEFAVVLEISISFTLHRLFRVRFSRARALDLWPLQLANGGDAGDNDFPSGLAVGRALTISLLV